MATAAQPGIWQWLGDGGWIDYDERSQQLLHQASQHGVDKAPLTVSGRTYVVDLTNMVQLNPMTGFTRAVRCASSNNAAGGVEEFWRWEVAPGVFKPFDPRVSQLFSAAKRDGRHVFQVRLGSWSYIIDLQASTQTNARTGTARRILPPGHDPAAAPAPAAAAARPAVDPAAFLVDVDSTDGSLKGHSCSICMCEFDDDQGGATALGAGSGGGGAARGSGGDEEKKDWSAASATSAAPPSSSAHADRPVRLRDCKGHFFHASCLLQALSRRLRCPVCSAVYGRAVGTQPAGSMVVTRHPATRVQLPGYGGHGAVEIVYSLPSGVQGAEHPHPGTPFTGTSRRAFLPDTTEGREVLRLLRAAFASRLLFRVGRSITTGVDNCVVWAGVHHKTHVSGGPANHGYPDATYLARARDELAAIGITVEALTNEEQSRPLFDVDLTTATLPAPAPVLAPAPAPAFAQVAPIAAGTAAAAAGVPSFSFAATPASPAYLGWPTPSAGAVHFGGSPAPAPTPAGAPAPTPAHAPVPAPAPAPTAAATQDSVLDDFDDEEDDEDYEDEGEDDFSDELEGEEEYEDSEEEFA